MLLQGPGSDQLSGFISKWKTTPLYDKQENSLVASVKSLADIVVKYGGEFYFEDQNLRIDSYDNLLQSLRFCIAALSDLLEKHPNLHQSFKSSGSRHSEDQNSSSGSEFNRFLRSFDGRFQSCCASLVSKSNSQQTDENDFKSVNNQVNNAAIRRPLSEISIDKNKLPSVVPKLDLSNLNQQSTETSSHCCSHFQDPTWLSCSSCYLFLKNHPKLAEGPCGKNNQNNEENYRTNLNPCGFPSSARNNSSQQSSRDYLSNRFKGDMKQMYDSGSISTIHEETGDWNLIGFEPKPENLFKKKNRLATEQLLTSRNTPSLSLVFLPSINVDFSEDSVIHQPYRNLILSIKNAQKNSALVKNALEAQSKNSSFNNQIKIDFLLSQETATVDHLTKITSNFNDLISSFAK